MTVGPQDVIRYRMERAEQALDEARLMAGAGHWNTCVSRLYYACFNAVTALLLSEGLESAKHSGVRSLFNQHFVREGRLDVEQGRLYNELFEWRREGDYRDLYMAEPDMVRANLPKAAEFVECIQHELNR